MNMEQDKRFIIWGGVSGIVGTLCYLAVAFVTFGLSLTYLLAMMWPILSIIFVYSLSRFVAIKKQSVVNQLALLFAIAGFAMVAAMISIQLGVGAGMEEYIDETPAQKETLSMIRRSARLVDIGLDVAWDLFIGTALIFLGLAISRHERFGYWWGIPSLILGVLLIILNVLTFPWPPADEGLFDIGPAIGVFILALSARLLYLGSRMKRYNSGTDK